MQQNEIYSLYIPKYKESKAEQGIGGYSLWWPLACKIHEFLLCAPEVDSIIVAPGYLSKTEHTTLWFLDELNKVIQSGSECLRSIAIGVLRGYNGFDFEKKSENVKKNFVRSDTDEKRFRILELHRHEYGKLEELKALGFTWESLSPVELITKDGGILHGSKSYDHSKLMFFIQGGLPPKTPQGNYCYGEYKAWLSRIHINAMVVGSSNFSFTTHFAHFDKCEADVLFYCHDAKTGEGVDFTQLISSQIRERNKEISTAINGESSEDDVMSEITDYESEALFGSLILSKSISMYPSTPQSFFKAALDGAFRQDNG